MWTNDSEGNKVLVNNDKTYSLKFDKEANKYVGFITVKTPLNNIKMELDIKGSPYLDEMMRQIEDIAARKCVTCW